MRRLVATPRRVIRWGLCARRATDYPADMRALPLLLLLVACHPAAPDPARPAIVPSEARTTTAPPTTETSAAPTTAARPAPAPTPSAHAGSPASASHAATSRFDEQVRDDFFDGLRGDAAALDRAVTLCEDTLAREPDHPEAMVWHGGAMIARARVAFRSGDTAQGMALYAQGLREMDRAVALAPDRVGVRIPRGAVLLTAAPFVPEPERSRLLERGVSDYEVALAAQAPRFSALTLHAREQLLYGLLDGYAGLGNAAKAQAYYQRMTVDAAGSQLLARAKTRAAGQPVAGPTPCQECHGR